MRQLTLFDQLNDNNSQPLDKESLLRKLERLHTLYHQGSLGGTSHEVHPGLKQECKENYLYFTLAPAINFQRKSESLWQAALKTYEDSRTRFVFDPASVVEGKDRFREALRKHGLALQTYKHTDIWFTICESLHELHNGDPRDLLARNGYNVTKIIEYLRDNKKRFPYLNGPKLANYWLYILMHYTNVPLVNREHISIIPDLHVIRATKYLGLTPTDEAVTPEEVARAWEVFLAGTNLVPTDLHAPLWRWSRRGFKPELQDL
jgi:hypothetical protein